MSVLNDFKPTLNDRFAPQKRRSVPDWETAATGREAPVAQLWGGTGRPLRGKLPELGQKQSLGQACVRGCFF